MPNTPDFDKPNSLTVALIVPTETRRRALIAALDGTRCTIAREFAEYPSREDLPKIARIECDVVIVDLDDDVEQAIHVIANICSYIPAVVAMACSSKNDSALLRRAMQAGAREFLTEPFVPKALGEAFDRAASRRPDQKKAAGKALVFVPAKGGVGVTTIALNFAVALVKESGAKVVVVDMDFQLGEIAPGLGMTASFSVVDALMSATRIDREFLETALIRHSSGLAVLGSPEKYSSFDLVANDGARRLFRILREEFDYVVVDAGPCHGDIQEMLFEMADTLYLVTEMTFPSLRNAHRIISFLSGGEGSRHVQVVANRFDSRHGRTDEAGAHGKIDEASAMKALTLPVSWKIPNAYVAVRDAQDRGVPVAVDSPYTRAIVQMARTACGKPPNATSKPRRAFGLFSLRGTASPVST